MRHICTQIVIKIDTISTSIQGSSVKLNSFTEATITPSATQGAKWDLFTGEISPAVSLAPSNQNMNIRNIYAQSIMLPLIYDGEIIVNFSITVNNETVPRVYQATLYAPNGRLDSGYSYMYTIVLGDNSVSISEVNLIDWITISVGTPITPMPI